MNTEPIYELRERLRAAAIAGTNLLAEDFRLKRAYEAFKPLEASSPIFAKIGQLTNNLLSPDCQNPQSALLDTITLADAVICTLGTVEAAGEVEPLGIEDTGENRNSAIVNAPYSELKELLEALTTSGGGRYGYVCDTRENHPELFRDYRVKYTLVQALGASYTELADNVEQWLREDNDRTVLPLLYRDFDPKGKKEMVRRVKVIDALAGADANDFYIKMLGEAQKDMRQALILALRHEQANVPLLMDMAKAERGKNKDAVFCVLANMEDKRAETCLTEAAGKQPEAVLQYLADAASMWSAELVEKICDTILKKFDMSGDISAMDKGELSQICLPFALVRALFGKSEASIRRCYQKLLDRKERINCYMDKWSKCNLCSVQWHTDWACNVVSNAFWYRRKQPETICIERVLDKILQQSLVANPTPDLQAFAVKLYEKYPDNIFLSSALTVKFLQDEDCAEWLEKQIATARYPSKCMGMVEEAAACIRWEEQQGTYRFACYWNGTIARPVNLSHAKELLRWFKGHATETLDEILTLWLPLNDKEMCQEMGEYFYNRISQVFSNERAYLRYMKMCGWMECKGLGVGYVKKHAGAIDSWETIYFMAELPGGRLAITEEFESVCHMIDSGRIKVDAAKYKAFKQRMDPYLKKE